MYWMTVTLYFLQSSQNWLAENLLRRAIVAPSKKHRKHQGGSTEKKKISPMRSFQMNEIQRVECLFHLMQSIMEMCFHPCEPPMCGRGADARGIILIQSRCPSGAYKVDVRKKDPRKWGGERALSSVPMTILPCVAKHVIT